MLLLPFRDDTRAPEAEQAMLKRLDGAPPRANDEQVSDSCAQLRRHICMSKNGFRRILDNR
jgi:hypothetical protein